MGRRVRPVRDRRRGRCARVRASGQSVRPSRPGCGAPSGSQALAEPLAEKWPAVRPVRVAAPQRGGQPMLGAIGGDIIGSIYEGRNTRTTDFPLFSPLSHPTDDTVLTVALADSI